MDDNLGTMSASDQDLEAYACYMTDEGEANEQRDRLERLFEAATAVEEIDGGLRLTIPREDGIAKTAAAFAVVESWCCPWARYALAFDPGREQIVLEVTGDDEGAELIQQYPAGEIPDGLEPPSLD